MLHLACSTTVSRGYPNNNIYITCILIFYNLKLLTSGIHCYPWKNILASMNCESEPNEDTKKITSGMVSYLRDLKRIHCILSDLQFSSIK